VLELPRRQSGRTIPCSTSSWRRTKKRPMNRGSLQRNTRKISCVDWRSTHWHWEFIKSKIKKLIVVGTRGLTPSKLQTWAYKTNLLNVIGPPPVSPRHHVVISEPKGRPSPFEAPFRKSGIIFGRLSARMLLFSALHASGVVYHP
jgi:hypothetical protein